MDVLRMGTGFLCGVALAIALLGLQTAPSTASLAVRAAPTLGRPISQVSGQNGLPSTTVLRSTAVPSTLAEPELLPQSQAPQNETLLRTFGMMMLPAAAALAFAARSLLAPKAVREAGEADHIISMAATAAEIEEEMKRTAPKPVQKRINRKPKFSKRRRALEALYQRKQLYNIEEALQIAKNGATAKFTESIDVAVNLGIDPRKSDQMVRGSVVLPAGTGKVVRVAAFCQGDALDKAKAAGAEFVGLQDLADLIKNGETGFDVVVATPDSMRVALQLGKILGPRGLMPNPKDGTVNADIEQAIRNAKAGQVKYRTDKAGSVHCSIGKTDFEIAQLKENLNAFLKELMRAKPATVKGVYMKKVVVSSSMGIGVYVDISSTAASR